MAEEEKISGNDEEPIILEQSDVVESESIQTTENTLETSPTKKSPSTETSRHWKNGRIIEITKAEVREKQKEKNDKESERSSRSRSKCRNRSRDPRRCQKHYREMIGKHESRNDQLERRECDLRKRLEILECSVPAVTVWNIWRMSQGAPISSIQRVIEKQFKGPIEERKIFPSTPSQHYDCRVREVETERKQAQRRAEEARSLWAQKEAALADRKRKIEEAKKFREDREKEVARLEEEAKEAREALERAKDDEAECTEGECGEIRCRKIWLNRIGSATSIRSTDLECLTRLQELAEVEVDLKRQIEELERREYAYMKTLEEADVLWAKMKGDTESNIDSLHEQLDLKILANQELAGRTCQLEDELERMRKQLSAAHSEIKRLKDVKGQDAVSGREDDFAEIVSRDITAETDQIDKDVDTADFVQLTSQEVTVKPEHKDKDTRVADDLVHMPSKDVTAVADQEDKSVGRMDDFALMTSKHTAAVPDQNDQSTRLDDLVQLANKDVTAVPDQTDRSTVPGSDLIKVSNKKITARPNQADQLSGHDMGHVTSSDIAVQENGDFHQQNSLESPIQKDIASGRPDDYAKVVDASGTVDQKGIDYAQLIIDMYSDDYGACSSDFACNDHVLSPIGIPLENNISCPPDFQCADVVPPKIKKTDVTGSIGPQTISIAATSSKRLEFIPAISESLEIDIKEDTSRVQEEVVAKVLTKEPKPLKDETEDEVLLKMEYLDVPGESTGSTGTAKEGLTDVARNEDILPRDDLNSSHDGTLRIRGVISISKRDDDDSEIEGHRVKRVDITEEGFSGETVAELTAELAVDLAKVQEEVRSYDVINNINTQVKNAEAPFLPIPETSPVSIIPEPEFPSEVDFEIPYEDAVGTPLELEGKDAKDSTAKVLDEDTEEGIPKDTKGVIAKKTETGSTVVLLETEFQEEIVRDTAQSAREKLTTWDDDLDRRHDEIKEDRLSEQVDIIKEEKSSDAEPEAKMWDETALDPKKEIISEDAEKTVKSSTAEVDEKGEEVAAEPEKENVMVTKSKKKVPAEADDIEEKKIAERVIEPRKDKEASEAEKLDKPAALSQQEVEKVMSLKVIAEVKQSRGKEEESRVPAYESGPKSDVGEEYKPTELIDEMKVTKPTLAKSKIVCEEKNKRKTSTPIVSSAKGPCICKPRTCPLEVSRSIKQSPDKPRTIYLTVQQQQQQQQRSSRISRIYQLFGESNLQSIVPDRKDVNLNSRIRKSRCRGSLRNQSTLTTTAVTTQTDTSCIRKSKIRELERDKAYVSSGLYPEKLESLSYNKGGNAKTTTTIFSSAGSKFIESSSSVGTDEVLCYSCGTPLAQKPSVSMEIISSLTHEKVQERDAKPSTTKTNEISKFLCRDCDYRATGEKSKIQSFRLNERVIKSEEPQNASNEKEVSCDCSTNVKDKYETRTTMDHVRKEKAETKDQGCLVKIPRIRTNAKISKNDFGIGIVARSKKRDKFGKKASCCCIVRSTASIRLERYENT